MFRLVHLCLVTLYVLLSALASSAATSRFSPIPSFPSGGKAVYTIAADFNRDGKLDVIASNTNGNVELLLGTGNGAFLAPKLITTMAGSAPSIASGDFNRDGKADLAVVSAPTNSVKVYLGHGDGTFASPVTVPTGASPSQVVIGDVNNDGRPDLLVGISGGFNVALGNGNGTFRAATKVPYANLVSLAVGDVNRDGHLDVVTTNGTGNDPNAGDEVFLGKGDGTFQDFGLQALGGTPILLADLNGDGKLDLINSQSCFDCSSFIAVFPGNGDGTFGNGPTLSGGSGPASLAALDLNGDAKLDLAVSNLDGTLSVFLNQGGGQFAPVANYATRSPSTGNQGSPAFGDFNGDKRPDLALATADGIQMFSNLGGGRLYAPPAIELFVPAATASAVDLNGDGHTDIALETAEFFAPEGISEALVLFGDGAGHFQKIDINDLRDPDTYVPPVAVADFNHDGRLDLAFAVGGQDTGVSVDFNNGNGTFGEGGFLALPNQPTMVAAGDFNNDRIADLAVLNGNEVDIYLGKGDGTFTVPTTYSVGSNPTMIVVWDVNRDGKRDLVVADKGSGDVSILLGKGDGTFAPAKNFFAGSHPAAVAVGDFNRDGKLDLAVGGDTMEILLGHGDGTFASPLSYSSGGPVTFVAQTDLRANNIEDLVIAHGTGNSITVLYGKGDGSFAAPTYYATGFGPRWLAVGDFNGDGAPDVVAVEGTALTLLWNQGGTRVALKSSATTAKVGQPVTFTATVQASILGAGSPVGTVAFKDGAKAIGFGHLSHGQAAFTTSSLSQGTHIITASYWGYGFFNPHLSPALAEKITP